MGKVLSRALKPFREFNIESRAHKIIGKDKPVPAPKYKSDAMNYERLLKENPGALQESLKKHEALDGFLKDVYLVSHDPMVKSEPQPSTNPDKPLPLNRHALEDFEYGFYEPKRVALGKVTLRKALRFISEHHVDPRNYNDTKIAEEYLLPKDTVSNILKNFKVYEIYIPQERETKATFFGPGVKRYRIYETKPKQIKGSKEDNDDSTKVT